MKLSLTFSIILAMIASLRYGIGNDFFGYYYLYKMYDDNIADAIKNPTNFREEIGFRIIAAIFKSMQLDFQWFILFFSILTVFIVYKTAQKYSEHPMISLFVFYSLFYTIWVLSGLRQGMVLFFGLYLVLYCFEKNKTITLIIGSLFLSCIHVSALIIILLYALAKLNIKKNYLFVLFLTSVILSILPINPIANILSLVNLGGRLEIYKSSDRLINFDFQSIARILLTITTFIYYNSLIKINKTYFFIVKYYIFGIIIYFLFKDVELVAARLSIYSRASEIIIIPAILMLSKNFKNKLYLGILILVFLFFNLAKDTNAMKNSVFVKPYVIPPYTNIINKNNFEYKKQSIYKSINFDDESEKSYEN